MTHHLKTVNAKSYYYEYQFKKEESMKIFTLLQDLVEKARQEDATAQSISDDFRGILKQIQTEGEVALSISPGGSIQPIMPTEVRPIEIASQINEVFKSEEGYSVEAKKNSQKYTTIHS